MPTHPATGGPPESLADWERENTPLLARLGAAFLVLGCLLRIARFFLNFPIWDDEAMLLVNYQQRGYLDVFGPIDNCQIAPLFFHWVEIASLQLFGWSDAAPRIVPLVCSVGGLCLFFSLCRSLLPPLAGMLAVGILAVSKWPIESAALAKPYAGDLLLAVIVLGLVVALFRRPSRLAPLVGLLIVVPLSVFASYPVVFLGGAASVALVRVFHRERVGPRVWVLFALYNVLLLAAFYVQVQVIGGRHLDSPDGTRTASLSMEHFWKSYFPPGNVLLWPVWLFRILAGQVMAYPVGAVNGGSVGTLALAMVGLVALFRRGQRDLAVFVVALFGLWLVAACLRKYPYGGSRTAQFSVPVVCLLIAYGSAVVLARLRTLPWRRTVGTIAVLLVLLAGIRTATDAAWPYHDEAARWARQQALEVAQDRQSGSLVVPSPLALAPLMRWHLLANGTPTIWADEERWGALGRDATALRLLAYDPATAHEEYARKLERGGRRWHLEKTDTWDGPQAWLKFTVYHLRASGDSTALQARRQR